MLSCYCTPCEIRADRPEGAGQYYTIVPLLYFIGGRAKVEIALAKGKQEWDERQSARGADVS